jgi:hypothetical protein
MSNQKKNERAKKRKPIAVNREGTQRKTALFSLFFYFLPGYLEKNRLEY